MRKKRNKLNTSISTVGYIKNYFGTDIGRILMPNMRNLQNCDIPYVPHQEAEDILNECLIGDPFKDKSLVFTGLTGSGKTTIIRHVFGLDSNANKTYIIEKKNIIIISVDFNRSQSSAQDAILSSLRSAIEEIVKEYGIDYPSSVNESFYEYIHIRRPDLLCLNPKHNDLTIHKEKMDVFQEKLPVTYASCQFQYVMDHSACNLQLAVLIVDNLEAFIAQHAKNSRSRYLAPVIEAFKLAECIGQRGDTTKWCFNMVIACRHHLWRIMKGEFMDNGQENALLQSYVTTEVPYDLAYPVHVNSIIQKREEVFAPKHHDLRKWNEAVKVVNTVFQTMEDSIGEFVMQIELKDLRKSMSTMQELIFHKGLQRQSDEEIANGAFQIDSVEQFDLTRVNLIRIIGLGNRKFYADSNSKIPNLLFNDRKDGMDLCVLFTLKYFLIQCGYTEPTWDNIVYVSEFYNVVKYLFKYNDNEINNKFGRAVQFLIQHRLLLRSADQSQDEVPGLSLEEVRRIEYVYVSGAAVKLWEELGKSSALFQLFMDDIWLDEELDYFGEDGNDIEHCIKYLRALYQIEKKLYNRVRNINLKLEESYIKTFGATPICKQLLNGLVASLGIISTSGDLRPYGRIEKAKETLKKARILSDEMTIWEQERTKYR